MGVAIDTPEIFKYGSTGLCIDFHLHTRADREIIYLLPTQRTIVDIKKGGQEAFNRRKEICQIWKP